MRDDGYVLITPVRNEEVYIETTIKAVVAQKTRPREWVIVSDGSTDRTDDIVRSYLTQYEFIQLVRRSANATRSFAAKVHAFKLGYQSLRQDGYAYIGNLDGDVSFDRDYHDRILAEFEADSRLGIAGGFIYEQRHGTFVSRPFNSEISVAGAVQLFRRECFEAIGGYVPLKYGAIDARAEVMARMNGWRVRSFADIPVHHHRRTSTATGNLLGRRFVQGRADYDLGTHPLFEAVKCLFRLLERPLLVGTLWRMAGFLWGTIRAETRTVDEAFVRYVRREQMQRLRRLLVGRLT